jgi:putative PIN family toxin of toxin-antitoxin system
MSERVVLDTNVLISALLFGGIPRLILLSGLRGEFLLCLSEDLLDELTFVLRRPKFGFPLRVTDVIRHNLTEQAYTTNPPHTLSIIQKDPADNRVLEAACESDADFIVTGDKHLLELGKHGDIVILSPKSFADRFTR